MRHVITEVGKIVKVSMATAKKGILTKDAVPRVLQSASGRQSRAQNLVVATCSDDKGDRDVRGELKCVYL
ncbi:hypothetical protein [Bradyrhizobium sp. Arg816]|uniref:hypothetical protein n=1 Tax=Bradyrhizobium sp. Arg816 TaxID=2998491 RepID=UPI00249F186E|nr:hypothetical protein [Bradyrhizobium sp. Arg816]MDI3562423.1 hypothetical protein [Bradyrhizobium sp. Arg816]